ncbi:MAG TPA: plasmid stabilization protein [Rhizomicrobium sp.]|jgi:plasmid stability protein|nr:plasmid stabilization protein [Rhizomicrobium sp.]
MASITIRNLKDDTKKKLRLRAAEHGRSLEAEVRDMLDRQVEAPHPKIGIAESIRRRFAPFGGVELEPLPDEILRDPRALPRRRKK